LYRITRRELEHRISTACSVYFGTRIGVRVARCLVRAVGWSRWGLFGLILWGLLGFCWVCSGCFCGLFVGALSELGSSLGALRRS
jgi:hypothetical protein